MRKFLLFAVIVWLSLASFAQTQYGYVKTKGRMVNGKLVPGTMISNAVIQIKGRNNLISRNNGVFSFPVTSGKSYLLLGARKEGYQMVDAEACREYHPSQTPLYIVMETPERQRADLREAQRKIRANLQRQLQEREAEIERLNIEQAQKDSLIDLLYQQQSDNEKLIADMARRYSEIDYDQLDEFYRQVSYCIEQGELIKADSLLRLRGDVNQQVEQQLQAGKAIHEEEEKVQRDKAMHTQVNEELARRCYSYYETFAAQHQRDSACHYLELRARLDTTNLDWLSDAGLYNVYIMARYDKALELFQSALRQSLPVDSGRNMGVAMAYNNIGLVYANQNTDSPKTLEFLLKGMRLVEDLKGTENDDVATCYNNVAMLYSSMDLLDLRMAYHLKSLAIREKLQSDDIDMSYSGVGGAYREKENFPLALEYLQKAYEASKKRRGEKDHHTVDYMDNIGFVYDTMMDIPVALDYYNKVLTIRKEIYGENHPDVGSSFNSIANIYFKKQDFSQALTFFQKALSVFKQRHDNASIAKEYQNIALCYQNLSDYHLALDNLRKALEKLGEDSNDAIKIYKNMSQAYLSLQDSTQAAKCQQKVAAIRSRYAITGDIVSDLREAKAETIAEYSQKLDEHLRTLSILESLFGPEHSDVADVCAQISQDYNYLRDLHMAEEYQARALSLRRKLNGEISLKVADSYLDYIMTFIQKGDYSQALEYATKAKDIKTRLLGADHPDVASIEILEGIVYIKTEQWGKVVEHFKHVLAVKEKTWGHDHIYSTDIMIQLANAYFQLGNYQTALSHLQRALKIQESVLGPNHSDVRQIREYIASLEETIQSEEGKKQAAERSREVEVITFTPLEDYDSPARQQGLDGEYIILEYCGWHIGDEQVFMSTLNTYKTQPKNIVLIKDGVITEHNFEEKMGARLKSKDLTKEEKQSLKETYEQWKSKSSTPR